jgi:hypothetical protein
MIRPFTCVCMILAAGSGLYVYQTKHRSQMLDREIARTLKSIDTTRERIGVLRGEWALLNEPERLAELARGHLALQTLSPTQFVSLADLGARLPAPLPAGSTTVPPADDAVPERPVPIAQAPARPMPQATAAAAPERPAPVQAAAAAPPPPKPAKPTATAAAGKPAPPPVELAQKPAGHITAPVVSVAAAPIGGGQNWIGESVLRAARARTVEASAEAPAPRPYAAPAPVRAPAPAYAPPPAASYDGTASALGGSRAALPPPVPYR